jgi:hypothetical protein
LNTKAKPNAKSGSNATNRCIISTGEIFAGGAIIDLVSGSSGINKPDLLLWNGSKAIVGPRVEHGGCIYEASKLTPSLRRALRLPTRCSNYGSARDLFAGIVDLFNRYLNFSDRESRLLTAFSMSTWLADRLPIAPGLIVSAPDQQSKCHGCSVACVAIP